MAIKTVNILVTGSAGYLGSPLCFDLLELGHNVVGIDNYIASNDQNTIKLKKYFKDKFSFYNHDLSKSITELNRIFSSHKPDIVVHFAALKSVKESIINPDLYWKNNVQSTENILKTMELSSCKKIIYSSSAAVYGNQDFQPIKETANLQPISVYAETKIACERLVEDYCRKHKINGISLRYFNPIGKHQSDLFRDTLKEVDGSLMNEIIKTSLDSNKTLKIYGKNYKTNDGTCERDYIHIIDLLDAHKKSINYIDKFSGYKAFNIGTGRPVSVIDLVNAFSKYNNVELNYEFTRKREGDVRSSYADVSKIFNELNWKSQKTLKDMVIDSWKAYSK